MYIESYKKFIVWQRSMELAKEIYGVTEKLPGHELYAFVSQMRRAAISIPSNIAEGYKRSGIGEFLHFLSIADASAAELETQLLLVKDIYRKIDFTKCEELLLEVQKMLIVMIKKLRDKKSLNAQRLTLNARKGFTLVELLVTMTLFLVVVSIATSVFISTLRTQRETVALIAANSNASLTLEQMSREIRTGTGFVMKGSDLAFTNAKSESVEYHLDSGTHTLQRSTDGGATFLPLTADNVSVQRATFRLWNGDPAVPYPPRITIALGVGAVGVPFTTSVANLEVSVSARSLQ
ncbi:MAG: four helix bundle protein [Patescibacteria group bacterium]|nr:four helix bundle protein [Patescibacteria group bacterium]